MTKERKLRQLVLRCVAFLLPLLLMLIGLSWLFLPKNNLEEFGMENQLANGVLGEPDNTLDVVIVGDSESYSAFSPMEIWKEQGFTSYVCGTHGQKLYESYAFMQKVFSTQSPKVVILETDAVYRKVTPSQVLFQEGGKLLPVFRYHDRWKTLNPNDFGGRIEYTYTTSFKGFYIKQDIKNASSKNYMNKSKKSKKIRKINQFYLDKIREICEAHGAELVLVSTPSTVNWNYKRHNGVEKYAEKYGLTYVDLNLKVKELGINWKEDSRDGGDHLNLSGAKKVSSWIGDWLKETYALPDHRAEEEYQSWNDCLEKYKTYVE